MSLQVVLWRANLRTNHARSPLLMTEETPDTRTRLRTIIVFVMLFAVFGAVVALAYFTTFKRPVTTVILVRHAEKKDEPSNPNPDLSDAGRARAQEIARLLKDAGVTAIYATQYARTQQTAQPLATELSLPVNQINSSETARLVEEITTKQRGGVVFVAGHNNTVPAAIAALGGPNYPIIPESEYDNLFIVTVYRFGSAKVLKLKYGSSAPAAGNQQMMVQP
jgi:phosphohistidine phosphatase SixA